MLRYYFLISILFSCIYGYTQICSVSKNISIPDNGKTYNIKIEANTSNSGNRVLCGVRLAFEHEFVDELEFVLVSPGGKQITLTASKSASSHSEGSSWNILFVRSDDDTNPDDFKKPHFYKNKWDKDQQYTGSYYPQDKIGLSHFDGEKLTGTWNLLYSDNIKGGKGILKSFGLIFCDRPIFCKPCQIPRDFITKYDYGNFCGGDVSLTNLNPTVVDSGIQSGYEYTFMVLDNKNNVIQKGRNPDLSQFSAGAYRIIAVQYRPGDSMFIAGVNNQKDLNNLFYGNKSSICGAYTKSSKKITILSDPGIQQVNLDVYGRDYVVIDGQYISFAQSITQSYTDQYGCDSLVRIQINFKSYNPVFNQTNTYNCKNTSVEISVATSPEFPIQRWFTHDGKISNQSEINSSQILAEAPGTYHVVFEIEDYLDTVSYNLITDPGTPIILLSNEYELCSSAPLSLSIGANYDTAIVSPSTTARIRGNTITIHEPDLYTLRVRKGDCELIKHVLVQPSSQGETIQIQDVALSCPNDSVSITPNLQSTFEHYSWIFQGYEIATTKNLKVTAPGLYMFRAYNKDDCGVSGSAWVRDNHSNVNLRISGPDLINCSNQDENNELIALFNGDFQAQWTLPGGATVTGVKAPIRGGGEYQVRLTNESGCTLSATKKIVENNSLIDFNVPDEVVIPCNTINTNISAEIKTLSQDYSIKWEGATPTELKSRATVKDTGTVLVSVTHNISQCTNTKKIVVRKEPGKPKLSFNPVLAPITCEDSVRMLSIEVTNCNNCDTTFTSSDEIEWKNGKLIAREPGTVEIELNNGVCVNSQTIRFPGRLSARELLVNKENIGCNDKPGRIEIKNQEDFTNIEFQTDGNTFPYTDPISNVTFPASYSVTYMDKENGCTGQQDIDVTMESTPPNIEYNPVVYLDCNTGKANLSVTGDDISRIVWFDPDSNQLSEEVKQIQVNEPGAYKFTALGHNYCYQNATIEVRDDRTLPDITLNSEYVLKCNESESGYIPSYDTTVLDSVIWFGSGGWSSSQYFPELATGEYRLLAMGKNGCTVSKKTTIIQETGGSPPEVIAPPITCLKSFSRVYLKDYTDVEEVQWIDENGQASLNDSFDVYNPGKIYLTIKKSNGCLITNNATVSEDKEQVSFTLNKPTINCHSLNPTLKTDITHQSDRSVYYQWYFGKTPMGREANHKIEYPGKYRVDVSYDNGCLDSLTYIVRLDTTAANIILRPDTISCSRSKIQLRKSVKTNIIDKALWTGPNGFESKAIRPSFQKPGIYRLDYTGKNGCKGEAEIEIFGDLVPPEVDSVGFLSLGCRGKEVDLSYFTNDTVTNQYWLLPDGQNLNDSIVQIQSKGDYILYLEGDNGCSIIDTFPIKESINPTFKLEVEDADCLDQKGNALILPALDTFRTIWRDPVTMNEIAQGHRSPELAAGSYLVTVANPLNGCDTTAVFEIKDITDILEVGISIDDSLRCERNVAVLTSSVYPPSDSYAYEWRYGTQPNVISQDSIATGISDEGLYTLTATDTVNNCTAIATFNNVRAPSRLRSFDLSLTEPACDLNNTGFAKVDSIKGASDMSQMLYSINNSPYLHRDTLPFLYANETYLISAKDQYGCSLDTVLMPELRGVMDRISQIPDTTINSGDTVNFNDPAFQLQYTSPDAPMAEKYTWILNPDTLSCDFNCTEKVQKQLFSSRTITTLLTNQYGCALSDTFNVYVREGDLLDLPNAIAPTSSTPSNSHACIYTNKYIATIELYVVFNRDGKIIFRRSGFDPNSPDQNFINCWNGRDSKDRIYPPGSYNYYVRYKTVYGDTKQRYGNLFLLR